MTISKTPSSVSLRYYRLRVGLAVMQLVSAGVKWRAVRSCHPDLVSECLELRRTGHVLLRIYCVFPVEACTSSDVHDGHNDDGEDGDAERAYGDVAESMIVAVVTLAPGCSGMCLALRFVDHVYRAIGCR